MMKFSLKHGLDLLAGLFLSTAALASESMPIEDRDAFEKMYFKCIMSSSKEDDCLVNLFSKYLDLPSRGDHGQSWKEGLGYCKPYAIYPVDKKIRGEIFDMRTYVIECSNGSLAGSYLSFRRMKEQWFLFEFSLRDSEEFVRKIIGIEFSIVPE
jgi:hypothetical protein